MFQWQETSSSRTEIDVGGSETTRTTHSHNRVWQVGHTEIKYFFGPKSITYGY